MIKKIFINTLLFAALSFSVLLTNLPSLSFAQMEGGTDTTVPGGTGDSGTGCNGPCPTDDTNYTGGTCPNGPNCNTDTTNHGETTNLSNLTKKCSNDVQVWEWEYCPSTPTTGTPGTQTGGSGGGTVSSGSNWTWGVGIGFNTGFNNGYRCWNGATYNYAWQCPGQYTQTPCTYNCGGTVVNPPTPVSCPTGTDNVNNQCMKKCTNATTGDWFYVSYTQQCPTAPVTPTCDATLGLYTINGRCVKKCGTTDIYYVEPSQQCNTAPACPTGQIVNNVCSRQCPDGSWIPVTSSCPVPPPVHVCWNNTTVQYQHQCPPQPPTYPCWNGQVYYQPGQCPPQVVTYVCWNGTTVNYAWQCPPKIEYQTCWNGARIPATQACPAQYQTCWNGQTILVTQQCPVKPPVCDDSCRPPVIANHNVKTNLVTRVAETSAQCNGVGLIANNTSSVGWFEYGETTALGKNTISGNIGSAASSPFSQSITSLKPNTTYYCRAVIANANGTYKGEIVAFKTLPGTKIIKNVPAAPVVTYVADKGGKGGSTKPIVKKSKTEFVCADGSLANAKTVSVADTVNAGGKLMQINLDKDQTNLPQTGVVNYKLTVKNTADTALTGTEVKFVLPQELAFEKLENIKNSKIENGILTVQEESFEAGEVKTYNIPVKVSDSATVGKTVVTTGYVSYYLPVIGSKLVKDETSAYMIGNIVGKEEAKKADGAAVVKKEKKDVNASFVGAIFPQTLLSWLILFAVVLIIVVLAMNIHSWILMRKKEKEEHVIHHHIS